MLPIAAICEINNMRKRGSHRLLLLPLVTTLNFQISQQPRFARLRLEQGSIPMLSASNVRTAVIWAADMSGHPCKMQYEDVLRDANRPQTCEV